MKEAESVVMAMITGNTTPNNQSLVEETMTNGGNIDNNNNSQLHKLAELWMMLLIVRKLILPV